MDLRFIYDQKMAKIGSYSGVCLQGRMFLLCYSSEGHKLLLDTRNNSGLLAIQIDKFHDPFEPSKTAVELVNFTYEWLNSQLDTPLVANLCRLVLSYSVASYVVRHGRKSVTSHSWNFHFMQTFAEWQVTRGGRAQVVGRSLIGRKASQVSRRSVASVSRRSGCGRGSGARVYADRLTNGVRGPRARKFVVGRSQVTLITWSIIHFLFTRMSVAPRNWCKR